MTPASFKEVQKNLGLTNQTCADVLNVSVRTVEKWRQGTRTIPGPVVVCLLLLGKYPGSVQFLLSLKKIGG